MGTRELLFLLVAMVVASTGILVAMNQVDAQNVSASRDALLTNCVTTISASKEWLVKPVELLGGGGVYTGFELKNIGIKQSGAGQFKDEVGDYAISTTSTTFKCTGTSNSVKKRDSDEYVKIQVKYIASTDSLASCQEVTGTDTACNL